MQEYDTHEHDVVVIGAGGAGLRAAIEASSMGVSVALVCKSMLGKAHTVMAEGGAAAALGNKDSRDSWKTHFRDTMKGGKYLNDWRMAQIHAKEAPDRIRELETWGAVFDRTKKGRINQRNFGGHTYPRLAHIGDATGLEIIRTLQEKGVHMGMDVFMEFTVCELFKDGDRVIGCLAYDRQRGRAHLFKAKSIVLATGGITRCWSVCSGSWEYTGDGHALAYWAGAEMGDMEFVQFHPTGMIWPPSVRGILVTEGVRGEKAAGRASEHGGAYLDISWRPPDQIKRKLPGMYHQFKELAGVDITKQPMEVGPTAHYVMGGVKVDPETQESTVKGLFAAGEAATGLHGTNRLGGNSLSDLVTFGRRAGLHAAKSATAIDSWTEIAADDVDSAIAKMMAPLSRKGGENPALIVNDLREMMQEKVGIIRNQESLEEALNDLESLRARSKNSSPGGGVIYNPGWHQALELEAMIDVSKMCALAALEREESRGGHTREDYPVPDHEKWGSLNSVISMNEQGEMQIEHRSYPPIPEDLIDLLDAEDLEGGH